MYSSDTSNKPTNPEQSQTTQEPRDRQCKTSEKKMNHVLAFVVFLVGLVIGILIPIFIRRIRSPVEEMAKRSFSIVHQFVFTNPREETLPTNSIDDE